MSISGDALRDYNPTGDLITDELIIPRAGDLNPFPQFTPQKHSPSTFELWTGAGKTGTQYTEKATADGVASSGDVHVDYNRGGRMTFHSSAADLGFYGTYYEIGTFARAKYINDIRNSVGSGDIADVAGNANLVSHSNDSSLHRTSTSDWSTTGSITGGSLVTGGDIGISGDTDLLQLAANALTVNGTIGCDTITVTANNDIEQSAGTGHITAGSEGFIVGTLTITDGSIDDTDGSIALGDTNLTGVGTIGCGAITTTAALTFSGANPNIIGGDTDGVLSITADTATNQGGNIKLYGNTHASLAQDIEFYADATKVLEWDESETNWDFNSQNVKGMGTVGCGALTSTGALTDGAASSLTTGTTIGNLTLADGSITDSGGAISFGDENLTTSGTVGIGVAPSSQYPLYVSDNSMSFTGSWIGAYWLNWKTAGASTNASAFRGGFFYTGLNQSEGVVGHMYGFQVRARVVDGSVGDGGGTRHIYGLYADVDLDGGTITGSARGAFVYIDQDGGTISGDAEVCYLIGDFDGTVTGTSYMLYLDERTGVDYGIYQNGTALNSLGGSLDLRTSTSYVGLGAAKGRIVFTDAATDIVAISDCVLRYGTHAAIDAETVTGYITIEDSAGTPRKIAVVS